MPWMQIYEATVMIMIRSWTPQEVPVAHPITSKSDWSLCSVELFTLDGTTKPILWVSHTPFQHWWNNIDILRNLATDFSVYLNWSQTKTDWDVSDYFPFLKAMNEIMSSKEWNEGRINNYNCIYIAFKHLLAHVFYNTKIKSSQLTSRALISNRTLYSYKDPKKSSAIITNFSEN
jgi:hypothetical protein